MSTARRTLRRRFGLVACLLAAASLTIGAAAAPGAQQIDRFDAGALDDAASPLTDFGYGGPVTQAGGRPDKAASTFLFKPFLGGGTFYPVEKPKDLTVELPPGFVGNPQAVTRCSIAALVQDVLGESCPVESQVGAAGLWTGVSSAGIIGGVEPVPIYVPVYNLGAANGTPAVFALNVAGVTNFATASVRTGDDYGVNIGTRNITIATNLHGVTYSFWGNPQDPSHDTERGFHIGIGLGCAQPPNGLVDVNCDPSPSSAPNLPFISLPTSCGAPPVAKISANSWYNTDQYAQASVITHDNSLPIPNPLSVEDCDQLNFPATLDARPTTNAGDSASGLDVDVHTPQVQDPNLPATPHLKDSVVTLPEGLVVNPSSANGLGTCDLSQMGYLGSSNEEQTVDLTGIGPFTLTFDGETTGQIPGDSESDAVQAALEALPNVAPGDVSVTGSSGGPYSVEFTGNLAGTDVPEMSADGLTNKIQKLTVDGSSGFYTLGYGADTTSFLASFYSVASLQGNINALAAVQTAGGGVTVTGGPGNAGGTSPYYIEFDGGSFAGTDQSISATPLFGLTSLTVTDEQAAGDPISGTVVTNQEVGLLKFTPDPADCPDAARLGSLEVDTPVLDHVIQGSVYLAKPYDNPFNSLLALYLTANDTQTGIGIKLAGEVQLDPDTGQVEAVFENNPQLPFEHLRLHFFGGSTGALRTPAVCGDHTTSSTLTPYSAPDSGPPVQDEDTWQITQNCAGSESGLPHDPDVDAGAVSPIAGAHSPFVVKLRREDGTQKFRSVTITPPPGLTAKLAGTPYCSDSALNAAKNKSGKAEEADASCPAASEVGDVSAAAGAGPAPYYAPGKAYLAGPYKGAPLSLAIVTPATAGPFDLGTIVVRTALHVNPVTAQITAESDNIPEILDGIPLDVREVVIDLDKPEFSKNPTSCEPMEVGGALVSTTGASAALAERFQLGECRRLGFKPKLFLRLYGKRFGRSSNPRLRAVLATRDGDANIARTAVLMPRSILLDQDNIRTICTRAQFATDTCPAGSVYGRAMATTPLLDDPLSGNVYLRSSNNPLPDLVSDLQGQVNVEAISRTDSVKGALRNTFDIVPDAPVSKFVLLLQGGNKSLLVASKNLCAGVQRARVNMLAHNGRKSLVRQPINIPRCKRQQAAKRRAAKRRAARRKAQRNRGARRASVSTARQAR